MKFELTNNERKYLGLKIVEEHWDKVKLTNEIHLYFDKDTIVKEIILNTNMYRESEYSEKTENREFLLPKTKRGKPKKLNFSSFTNRNGIGTYFECNLGSFLTIGNYTTQKTFYSTSFENIKINSFDGLKEWLSNWIKNSSEEDAKLISSFGKETRENIKYKKGNFFCFKIDRRNYGFGRLLLDIHKLKKEKTFNKEKNHGLTRLMTRPLVVKIYDKISKTKDVSLNELKTHKSFPSQYIMDNKLFYGDHEIIGNIELEDNELDFPISYSSIKDKSTGDDVAYIQYGLIYKEDKNVPFDKSINIEYKDYLELSEYDSRLKKYRKDGIGLGLNINKEIMENCIKSENHTFFWKSDWGKYDLRNPKHQSDKELIFNHFGLDANLNYSENYNKFKKNE